MGKGKKPTVEWVIDAAGNKVEKGSRTDPEMVAARAAAAARREAKAAAAAAAEQAAQGGAVEPTVQKNDDDEDDDHGLQKLAAPVTLGDPSDTVGSTTSSSAAPEVVDSGGPKKLTRKERKRLEQQAKMEAEAAALAEVSDCSVATTNTLARPVKEGVVSIPLPPLTPSQDPSKKA